jgi:hypothetical protein
VGFAATAAKECQVLHWKSGHKMGCWPGRVVPSRFSNARALLNAQTVNRPKHEGVAEPIRCKMAGDFDEVKERRRVDD